VTGGLAPLAAASAAPSAVAEWTYRPWREHPARSAAGALLGVALCAAIVSLREPPFVTIVLSIAAVGALAPLFVAAHCRVDAEGVARGGATGASRRRWEEIRRATLRRDGVLLSPAATPRWLDSWRALWLPFPAADRDALRTAIRPLLERHGLAG